MREFGKFILYVMISSIVSGIAYWSGSKFINEFSGSILPLLSTILAINITTSALLSGEIRKFVTHVPNTEPAFNETIKEIKWTFKIQIFLICILFLILILKDAEILKSLEYYGWIEFISNTVVVGVFGYFLEIIFDLGVALFKIINHNKDL